MFKHKKTAARSYLLDKQLGIESHERITEDAEALLLEEAAKSSYSRGGNAVSITEDVVSKQTVKDRLHELAFPEEKYSGPRKNVDYLYIDANEDHTALQKQNRDMHSTIIKLVYVYEGIAPEFPGSKRRRLVNPHYFSGLYSGGDNVKLWNKVYKYIESHYNLEGVKKIYLNANGEAWIKTGVNILSAKYVLDEFHLRKSVNSIANSVKENGSLLKKQIYTFLKEGKRKELEKLLEMVAEGTDTSGEESKVLQAMKYLLNNWSAARARVSEDDTILPCSAEGHVSYIMSSRMSSRPMSWSYKGAEAVAKLRAYLLNGGNTLSLVRYQRKKVVVGADEMVLSCSAMLAEENRQHKENGKYYDRIQASISN